MKELNTLKDKHFAELREGIRLEILNANLHFNLLWQMLDAPVEIANVMLMSFLQNYLNRPGIDEKLLFRSFFVRKYPQISARFSARLIYDRFLSVLEHAFPSAPRFPYPKIILVSDQMTGWVTKRIS